MNNVASAKFTLGRHTSAIPTTEGDTTMTTPIRHAQALTGGREKGTLTTSIGRPLTDERGRLTVRRVLSVDDGAAKVETTFETEGSLGDVHYTTLGTLTSVIRPDGTLYGSVKAGLRTDGNDTGVYRGITGGKYTEGTPHARTYRGAITFENTRGALAELNSVFAVFELDIDDAGQVSFRTWELA
jgi:hypothetical protein